jgi:hypothetical protein
MRAGEPRFPVAEWDHDNVRAWLVSGSPNCGRDIAGELSLAHVRGVVALTLEAAAMPAHSSGLRVVTASAGVVPSAAAADPRDDELRRFGAALGNISWWTALGRDAATLARLAVDELPTETVTALSSIRQRRVSARDRLSSARARLWSTEQVAWTTAHTMSRTVCTVDVALAGLAESPRADPQ